MGERRRYSDDERATALAALAANGGNVERTAAQLAMPRKTLASWAKGERHPEAAQLCQGKKGPMADALDAIAWKILDSLPGKIASAPLAQSMTALGIAIDKARLLRGEPTDITEVQDGKLAEFHANWGAAHADDPAPADGADAGPQPVHPPGAHPAADPLP